MSQLPFHFANSSESPPASTTTSFQITTKPKTDIWKKIGPPEVSRFNAPILYKKVTLSSFQRMRVTVTANWTALYDQGGLIMVLPQPDGTRKWIKSQIEFFQGEPFISTVSADRGADMSLLQTGLKGEKKNELMLEFRKVHGALWIYVVDGGKSVPIREVTWAFGGAEEQECWVGVFAARPGVNVKQQDESLAVSFEDFELDIE
ncbi:hypothetical protein ONS95_007270 [Cadophora gregata]|uniref:uncharacterized protein n=1 Tax=Cadophora gregata TaxID=51156 RepID=UPI0026DB841A|nr:uncharacterized protein ONS95_007270 [Cadophora gregata]KAK0100822.1 hypothetical protein ONS95_007270 [Cadophora gregata]KAK0117184.1 hypothetical protein ONS96_013017 [Cadophora gregata f. sp. sojae]